MSARNLTKELGGNWCGSYGLVPGPGHSRKDRSLKVWDSNGQTYVHSFAGDDWRMCRAYLGLADDHGVLTYSSRSSTPRGTAAARNLRHATPLRVGYAKRIWAESQPATRTLVETYLRSRNITIEPPPTLRYHAGLKHGPTGLFLPAMVAAVTIWPSRDIVAIHRTFLVADGRRKAAVSQNKMMLGPCSRGAVRLVEAGDELVLAEGIETGLSLLQAARKPVWACLSTSGLKAVILPPDVKSVVIAVDGDEAGERAAQDAARRLYLEGREVKIARPPAGLDFNDMAREEAANMVRDSAA